jgi:hypothetical protein
MKQNAEYKKTWKLKNKKQEIQNNKDWYINNKENVAARKSNFYSNNKEKERLRTKIYRKKNPDRVRGNELRYNYWPSLSWQEALQAYKNLFDSQQGCCPICKKHQTEFNKKFAVDHCHETGKIRGLLCDACNKAIGLLNDDHETALSAHSYLKTHDVN